MNEFHLSQNPNLKSNILSYISNRTNDLNLRTLNYSLAMISYVGQLPTTRMYWVISDQLLRAATSVGSNVREAKGSSSRREFCRFYEIALKSTNESIYWLELLYKSDLDSSEICHGLQKEAEEIGRMLAASLLTIRGKRSISR